MTRPVRVAIIGGGCAAMATAFELSRPEHRGRYQITVYQQGWRLGGKGASGRRAPSQRIEEHGLHVWLGYYENAFRLLRQCYEELDRDPKTCPISRCFDAFEPTHLISLADDAPGGRWHLWSAQFPATSERPGEAFGRRHPFTLPHYLGRAVRLLRTLLISAQDTRPMAGAADTTNPPSPGASAPPLRPPFEAIDRLLRLGTLASLTAVIEALGLLETSMRSVIPEASKNLMVHFIDLIATSSRSILHTVLEDDLEMRSGLVSRGPRPGLPTRIGPFWPGQRPPRPGRH